MPAYGGEIQACSLGIDIQCFDEEGKCRTQQSNLIEKKTFVLLFY